MAYPVSPPRHTRRSGVTLIELLLALGIAVLLVTLLYSVYHTVALTAEGQDARRRETDPVAATIETLLHDLAAAILPGDDRSCAFVLEPDPAMGEQFDSLTCCSGATAPETRDARWAVFERLHYRVIPDGAGFTLARESTPLTGPGSAGPAVTNSLLPRVERFKVQVYDGKTWRADWPPEGQAEKKVRPQAARIEFMRSGDPAPTRVECVIAAGLPVKKPEASKPTPVP
jgi:type II secretory pathway component PulJ